MAEVAILRRASFHELTITLDPVEAKHMFGEQIPEEPRCAFMGNGKQGVVLLPTTETDRSTRKMNVLTPGPRKGPGVIRVWIKAADLGLIQEYRAQPFFKTRLLPRGMVFIPGLPEKWHGPTMPLALQQRSINLDNLERLKPADNKPAVEAPPPPRVEAPIEIEAPLPPPEMRAAEPVRTPPPTIPGPPRSIELETDDDFEQNLPPFSVRQTADSKRDARKKLGEAVALANRLKAEAGDEMKLVVDDEGYINIVRTYRPGAPVRSRAAASQPQPGGNGHTPTHHTENGTRIAVSGRA
jgi:hypothetical protein